MKDPTPIRDLLGELLTDLGVANPEDAIALLERWTELTPAPWSERATPLALRDGVLEVEVADGTTASLLRYQASQLVAHLSVSVGSGLVGEVRISVARHRKRS